MERKELQMSAVTMAQLLMLGKLFLHARRGGIKPECDDVAEKVWISPSRRDGSDSR